MGSGSREFRIDTDELLLREQINAEQLFHLSFSTFVFSVGLPPVSVVVFLLCLFRLDLTSPSTLTMSLFLLLLFLALRGVR